MERLTECDAFFEVNKEKRNKSQSFQTSDEYYFERSPAIFEYIVDFYITGKRALDRIIPFRSIELLF